MYENLYAPIPDVDAYLDRLQLGSSVRTDLDFLDSLVYFHQCSIPFENLDSYVFHLPVSLEIPDIFKKIIINRRGGYCFELNALFNQLLRDLGVHAYACMCRIIEEGYVVPLVSHRAVLVELGQKLYFCDVGFGGPTPPGAVPVEDGASRSFGRETYFIDRTDSYWWTLSRTRSSGAHEKIMQFYTMPQENVDYLALNEFYSNSPESDFTQMLYLNIRTPSGCNSIVGDVFTRISDGHAAQRNIQSEDDFYQILKDDFKLPISL